MDKTKLVVDTSSKEFMFKLGIMFAQGKQIEITNKAKVDKKIEEEHKLGYAKSFNMMIKYWQDNGLMQDFSKITPNPNKLFLICPVRNATSEEKISLVKTIEKYEKLGYAVHYPERDTNQNPIVNCENTGGFNICCENALAIAEAETVSIFYNKSSTGSMFDLGVTCCLQNLHKQKKFVVENSFDYDENNIIDRTIKVLSESTLESPCNGN